MATDTRFVVDSFALCNRFAALGTTKADNSLLPQSYGRVQTPYLKQNRKDSFQIAYGETNKTYTFPESLQVLATAYVKVCLRAPTLSTRCTFAATGTWSTLYRTVR